MAARLTHLFTDGGLARSNPTEFEKTHLHIIFFWRHRDVIMMSRIDFGSCLPIILDSSFNSL